MRKAVLAQSPARRGRDAVSQDSGRCDCWRWLGLSRRLASWRPVLAFRCDGAAKIAANVVILWFVLGLVTLVFGAEILVRGATRLAAACGVSPLVAGLTIVAFGTSAPELAVSVSAALSGSSDLAVANVVGSNIFNVLLILGLSALITPLVVHAQVIRQELPIMLGASLLATLFALDGSIGLVEAAVLLVLLVAYTVFLVRQSRTESAAVQLEFGGPVVQVVTAKSAVMNAGLVLAGLGLLVVGSQWLMDACVAVATALGVDNTVIGLTIVAAGTSMPELATSIVAAVRGQRDIAVGNVVGSNIFNLLGCLGAAGIVSSQGLAVAPAMLRVDVWVMVAVALACMPIFASDGAVTRREGALLVFGYGAYTVWLVLAAQSHDSLPSYSTLLLSYVVPMLVVLLTIAWVRSAGRANAS